ncbi:MAG: CbiX/SirB N-terminal domain-containing protein [Acidobacteriota bacterium]
MTRHLYRLGIDLGRFKPEERRAWRLHGVGLRGALDDVFGADGLHPEALSVSEPGRSDLYVAGLEPVASSRLRELFARLVDQIPHTFALEIERDEQVIKRMLRARPQVLARALERALRRGVLEPSSILATLAGRAAELSSEGSPAEVLDGASFEGLAGELTLAWRRQRRLGGRPAVLAAHGAGDGSPANAAVESLAEEVGRRLLLDHVGTAFHKGTPAFQHVPARAIVLPLLTSRGFFYGRLLRSLGDGPVLLPPLGEDPRLGDLVEAELISRLDSTPHNDVAVVVVGHGTRRHRDSGLTTGSLAERLRRRLPGAIVTRAFLDQEPNLGTVATRVAALRRTVVTVPFLLGYASHAKDDVDRALRASGAERRIDLPPLLDLPGLTDLLVAVLGGSDLRRAA